MPPDPLIPPDLPFAPVPPLPPEPEPEPPLPLAPAPDPGLDLPLPPPIVELPVATAPSSSEPSFGPRVPDFTPDFSGLGGL